MHFEVCCIGSRVAVGRRGEMPPHSSPRVDDYLWHVAIGFEQQIVSGRQSRSRQLRHAQLLAAPFHVPEVVLNLLGARFNSGERAASAAPAYHPAGWRRLQADARLALLTIGANPHFRFASTLFDAVTIRCHECPLLRLTRVK
jgi:hypothetical protein